MDIEFLQIMAGTASSALFVSSNLPMLWKAFSTKNLQSYSLGHIGLSNCGNLIFWLYVFGLPVGPIWFLHSFNTIAAGLMLLWYLRYRRRSAPVLDKSMPLCLTENSCLDRRLEIEKRVAWNTPSFSDTCYRFC